MRYAASIRAVFAAVCLLFLCGRRSHAQTPANEALRHFRKGANLGNYLEVPPGQTWAVHYTTNDLDHMKSEGFDHIRVPIGWHHYAGPAPKFELRTEIYEKVDSVVTNALARGLSVLINIHHFDDLTSHPAAKTEEFLAIWRQIAAHYQKTPNDLAFELLNEPKDAATTENMNPIYAKAIAEIRKLNPGRTIFVGPGKWNSLDEVSKLRLPEDDNLVVTVHSYEPFYFTHQGATWAGPDLSTKGVIYPGPPPYPVTPDASAASKERMVKWFERYNTLPPAENPCGPSAFKARMEKVAAWATEHNRPVYLGEFGAYTAADQASRARYYADMRKTAERLSWGWAIWDWRAGFNYWKGDAPMAGMHEALFGAN